VLLLARKHLIAVPLDAFQRKLELAHDAARKLVALGGMTAELRKTATVVLDQAVCGFDCNVGHCENLLLD
jgi:hypothetical protein